MRRIKNGSPANHNEEATQTNYKKNTSSPNQKGVEND